ncbi:MMPL family transporter (plasmid) [Alkalihalophilus pseudofirmus]|uniref:MMPL family transporter n=1 Tax=Alkalihalophilus pseudofirmus TaxID=79885 RepID=UPI00259B5656|nr:MMPL family transporter [Alkalihalophilus pseudofirmus]WEG19177.1 MMPL family transporter [Alkalihalophilus pseudofirmus]
MKKMVQIISKIITSKWGAKGIIAGWIAIVIILTLVAPPASEHAKSVPVSGLPETAQSVIGNQLESKFYDEQEGTPALFVYTNEGKFGRDELDSVERFTEQVQELGWPEVEAILPFEHVPEEAQSIFLSEDESTLVIPLFLVNGLESSEMSETLSKLEKLSNELLGSTDITLYVSGPAGIAADATGIFANANITLIFISIVLIFVLLIVIYRSPVLALLPLIAAGIVYQVVDRTLGLAGQAGMEIEAQSLSIMSILLFAAITDYALFLTSRFREELQLQENKFIAMQKTVKGVGIAIFFSGATIIGALIVLFLATFQVYRNFAPVFTIAMVIILLAGITLLPAMYLLAGRKAFWPFIPKVEKSNSASLKIWDRISKKVTKKPLVSGLAVLVLFLIMLANVTQVNFSFNLIKSFPEDMPSRIGIELLNEGFLPGEFTPTTAIIDARNTDFVTTERIEKLQAIIADQHGVREVDEIEVSEENEKIVKFDLWFENDPYHINTLNQLEAILNKQQEFLTQVDIPSANMYFIGETAEQVDIKNVNERDLWVLLPLITLVITLLLFWQTKSVIAPLYMVFTILLSYGASLGISYWIFQNLLGHEAISYRIPLYTFVFSVALGVDYSIMLVTRIQEEMRQHSVKKSVQLAIKHTGGVISSAGLILAATFAVLMTQPLLELYMFGFTVALGVLLDTFFVRTILVPAIIIKLDKYSF